MTHRERVLTALDHREPDRVPVDLWGSATNDVAGHPTVTYHPLEGAGVSDIEYYTI